MNENWGGKPGSPSSLRDRQESEKTDARALHYFYLRGKRGATVSGEGSFDTVNQFDAFNSDGAQLFEIDPRVLNKV